jgi:Rieske Fe-S protein
MEEMQPAPRRSFIKRIALIGFAVTVGGVIALREWFRSRSNPARVIAHTDEIPVGGSLIFQYPADGDPCFLIRPAADSYLAFSRICTHNSCPVHYRADLNEFICPCHNGVYSASDGSVLGGPPPRPLPRIQLERRGADIIATGIVKT